MFILIFRYIPQYGQTHILFYIGVCSLVGSLSVRLLSSVLCWKELFFNTSLQHTSVNRFNVTGHECQSTWNCFEANTLRNESTNISTDMVLYVGGGCLCYYPNELFKQGIIFISSLTPIQILIVCRFITKPSNYVLHEILILRYCCDTSNSSSKLCFKLSF